MKPCGVVNYGEGDWGKREAYTAEEVFFDVEVDVGAAFVDDFQ